MHPTSALCKSISWLASNPTPNLNAIGPAVVKLPRVLYAEMTEQDILKESVERWNRSGNRR